MFLVKPCSEKAKRLVFYPNFGDKPPFIGTRIGKEFPFAAMGIGQSFFMQRRECSLPEFSLVKQRIARYNRMYAVYFATVKHNDEPQRLEIVRLA